MQIVSQSATALYSLFPPCPLLSAPPVYLALPAPHTTALLAEPKLTIVIEKRTPLDDLIDRIGPIRSKEEMDAELYALMDDRTRQFYEYAISREM